MGRTVFFIGATGYIGAQALDRILDADATATVTVLVRDEARAAKFAKLDSRLMPLVGSMTDCSLLEEQAAKHDVVVNTANADDQEATEALIKGLSTREGGVLIHTSGTGVLSDIDDGSTTNDRIYTDHADDSNPSWNPISSLPDTQLHRNVDLVIEKAAAAGKIRAYIVAPSTIYGIAKNRFTEAGLANPQSQQMPYLIRVSIARGKPARIGLGKNIWNNVHTDDQGDLFGLVYKHAMADNGAKKEAQFFIGEGGEYFLGDASKAIGAALAKRGLVDDAAPVTLTKDELETYFGGSHFLGSNSRGRGVHSRLIGWKPKYTTDDFIKSLDNEVEVTNGSKKGRGADGKFAFGKGFATVQNGIWVLPEDHF